MVHITLPARYKSFLYTNFHYDGILGMSRSNLDFKYIYSIAFYNRNKLEDYQKIIENYEHQIRLEVSPRLLNAGFKGVGEYALVDINQYLSSKFDQDFIHFMYIQGFNHSKRYPGYADGVQEFMQLYDIDEAELSSEALLKYYYRFRRLHKSMQRKRTQLT